MTNLGHAETLNEAIYKVLTTTMKKWCEVEYKMVKDAGYQINKEGRGDDGYFVIRNPHTHRYIYVTANWKYEYIHTNNCHEDSYEERSHSFKKSDEALRKIDYVALLAKPVNRNYLDAKWKRERLNESKALEDYRRLKNARYDIDWGQKQIDMAKKKLQEAQENLEHYIKKASEAENYYKEVRRELGLA